MLLKDVLSIKWIILASIKIIFMNLKFTYVKMKTLGVLAVLVILIILEFTCFTSILIFSFLDHIAANVIRIV